MPGFIRCTFNYIYHQLHEHSPHMGVWRPTFDLPILLFHYLFYYLSLFHSLVITFARVDYGWRSRGQIRINGTYYLYKFTVKGESNGV